MKPIAPSQLRRIWVLTIALTTACGDDKQTGERDVGVAVTDAGEPSDGAAEASDGGEDDADTALDADAHDHQEDPHEHHADDATTDSDIPTYDDCEPASYVDLSGPDDERVIAGQGRYYDPSCIIVAVGQTVRWEGVNYHPLRPGTAMDSNAGSPNSPVKSTDHVASVEFTFDNVGTYPFYCSTHTTRYGGMTGSVHVVERAQADAGI